MTGCWEAVPGKRTPIEKVKDILSGMMASSSNYYGYLMVSASDTDIKEEETAAEYPTI